MKYRPDIDGLRAVAVMLVVLYHAHLGFPGGYVGVDVFFVISGFLICQTIQRSILSGSFRYRAFWERRARRLIPALMATTLVTAIAGYFILIPQHAVRLGGSILAQPLLLANVYFWRTVPAGYFEQEPETNPLLHTWSLGVEEQFYLLFPLVLLSIRRCQPSTRAWLLGSGALASLSLSYLLTPDKPVFAFFNLPTRAWEFLLGAGLVGLPPVRPGTSAEILGWTGGIALVTSACLFGEATLFPGVAAVVPCLGTSFLIVANRETLTSTGRLLAWKPLVGVGLTSYSVYLWHWPLLSYARYLRLTDLSGTAPFAVLLTLLLGYLSWRWLEMPIRERRVLTSSRSLVAFVAFYALACGLLGGLSYQSNGFPGNWSQEAHSFCAGFKDQGMRYPTDPTSDEPVLPSLGPKDHPLKFLLWGDSHAMALAAGLNSLGHRYQVAGRMLCSMGAAPLLNWGYSDGQVDKTDEWRRQWSELAVQTARSEGVEVVLLAAYWRQYSRDSLSSELADTVARFERQGIRVIVIADVPKQEGSPPLNLALATRWPGAHRPPTSAREHEIGNSRPVAAFRSVGVEVIDPATLILEWQTLGRDGHPLYWDDDHLSLYGSLAVMSVFEPLFEELAAQ